MKISAIVGIVLILAGAFLLFTGGSFTSRRDVLDVGGLTITAEEKRPISPWVGAAAIIGGLALVIQGARRSG